MTACIFETIKLFQRHGLKTSLLICDRGSANILVIKASHRRHGAYSLNKDAVDIFEIQPWIRNPFSSPNKIFWLICPSHQVSVACHIVILLYTCFVAQEHHNALFSSKEKGTKQFQRGKDSVILGWKSIIDYISMSWQGSAMDRQGWCHD